MKPITLAVTLCALFAAATIVTVIGESSDQEQMKLAQIPTPLTAKYVCMVNDTYMGKDQIPVAVGDKTYFGCCEACVFRINNDSSIRYTQDPLTGKQVDKASAYIVLKPGTRDKVDYFESEENYQRYTKR